MKQKLQLLLTLVLGSQIAMAQTVLWEEDFESYSQNTGVRGIDATPVGDFENLPFTVDASDTSFNDSDNDYIQIDGTSEFELQMRDLDGEAIVTFNEIDISTATGMVTVSFSDVDFNITSSTSAWSIDASEYIDIFYSLDSGDNYIRIPNHMGNGNADHTFITPPTPTGMDRDGMDFNFSLSELIDPGAATSIIIQIRAENDGANEEFEFDDLIISRGGTELYNEPFQSFINGMGMPQDFATPSGFLGLGSETFESSGDYPSGVTAWTITPTDNTHLEASDDFALVTDASENGTQVFKYNDVNDPVTFETEVIDITGEAEITFGFDITFDETDYESSDFLDVFYSIDGGVTYTLAQDDGSGNTFGGDNITANFNTPATKNVTFSETLSGLSVTDLIIRIVADNNSAAEDYEFDNIQVVTGSTLSIADSTFKNLKVYPNPVTDGIINIQSQLNGEMAINLYDITGKEVYNAKLLEHKFNISHLNSGVYLLKISQNGNSVIRKIVK